MKHFYTQNTFFYLAAVLVILLVLTALGPWVNSTLAWNRHGLESGQWWRLLSGHLVHTNVWHGLLNTGALAMALYLFGGSLSLKQWLLSIVLLGLVISVGLYVFEPWLENYVGFSGVLYGIFALCLIKTFRQKPLFNSLLFIGLSWKVLAQQMPGFDTQYLRSTIEATVIVDAHWYGYLCGSILGAVALLLPSWKKKIHAVSNRDQQ